MAQILHPSPNFLINSVKGWNSRVLYTYYGHYAYEYDYFVYQEDYTADLFDGANTWSGENNIVVSKGQYAFPAYSRFFKTGKSIRIKGFILVSSNDTSAVFNMRASIINVTNSNTKTLIAAQNNNNDHSFSDAADKTDVPVSFEIIYSSVETDDTDLPLYFQANGFYEYDYSSYDAGGNNRSNTYVPIYNTTQFTTVGNINDEYKLSLSFDGSDRISNIKVHHIIIEELT